MKTPPTSLLVICLLAAAEHLAGAFYNPEVGRWANRDPIQEDGGINIYCSSNNDPINAIDPTGLAGIEFSSYGQRSNDPAYWSYLRWHGASGSRTGTLDAFEFQEVHAKEVPSWWPGAGGGGPTAICNSGSSPSTSGGTYVTAKAINTDNADHRVAFSCSLYFRGEIQADGTSVLPGFRPTPSGIQLSGHILDSTYYSRRVGVPSHGRLRAVTVQHKTVTGTKCIKAHSEYEVYNIESTIRVNAVGNAYDNWFTEQLDVACVAIDLGCCR